MRAGLSTIQQTLTPEAAAVLTQSISEAARRNHGQTTPLHVAAALISSPSGLLRQACIKSQPNSSHPLQCRALELCFSVALNRLPSIPTSSPNTGSGNDSAEASEPPVSNALVATLKRAQAHQRRGCPEQQQSPLLAVKVELDQLVVSILDDPSVSRVMKEASFSSPAVKATIERSMSSSAVAAAGPLSTSLQGLGSGRNLYMNPRLQPLPPQPKNKQGDAAAGGDEVTKVMEILSRSRKRNPVLVGDSDLSCILKEVLERAERRELGRAVRVVSLEKEFGCLVRAQIPEKIRELRALVESRTEGVVLDLGDLRWFVEGSGGTGARAQQQMMPEIGNEAVAEMGRIISGGSGGRVWAVGTATCATYLRCQVYYPTMESEWHLQAVPIAPRAPNPGLFPRIGSCNGILSNSCSIEIIAQPKGFPAALPVRRPPETVTDNNSQKQALCAQCSENYERELAMLVADELDNARSGSRPEPRLALPRWLQIAAPSGPKLTEELLKRCRQTCSRLHSNAFPPIQWSNSERPASPPSSPVKTDLVLGCPKPPTALNERIKDFHGWNTTNGNIANFQDPDSLKRLFKGLMERVPWQTEAVSAVTAAVLQSKSGNGKRRGLMPNADTWLFFIGPDRVGKKKVASALSELVFGVEPFTVRLNGPMTEGDDGDSNINSRGRTALDSVAEAVKRNPFSVIVLLDIDRADAVVRGTVKLAMERGRLPDSHGREVSLGSTIFVLTANWLPDELKCSTDCMLAEEKILSSGSSDWQLEVSFGRKRLPDWLRNNDSPTKVRKESNGMGLSLDLNLATGVTGDDENDEGSRNSSDVTVEHEHGHGRLAIKHSVSSASEFVDSVDNAVVFKPVDFAPLRRRISESISSKFSAIFCSGRAVRIDDKVLDRIVGDVWVAGVRVEEWTERVLAPSIKQLAGNSSIVDDGAAIRLSAVDAGGRSAGDWLPGSVRLAGI